MRRFFGVILLIGGLIAGIIGGGMLYTEHERRSEFGRNLGEIKPGYRGFSKADFQDGVLTIACGAGALVLGLCLRPWKSA